MGAQIESPYINCDELQEKVIGREIQNYSGSSVLDISNMNRVLLRASENEQRYSEEVLTFKVGRK